MMSRWTLCGWVALGLLIGAGSAYATKMYRWVDAQGVVHYSDQAQPGAQSIEMQSAQTYRAPAPSRPAANATPAGGQPSNGQASKSAYQSCAITQPTAEQEFFAPESVTVQVSLEPALRDGDQLVVSVDGLGLSAGSSTQTFQLAQPDRGSHTINASVRTPEGKSACTAAAVTFSVQRPSRLSPASPTRGAH
jgi:hypothetical protein